MLSASKKLLNKASITMQVKGARAMSAYARSLDASSIKGRHLDDLFSFTSTELETMLRISHALKSKMGVKKEIYQPLVGSLVAIGSSAYRDARSGDRFITNNPIYQERYLYLKIQSTM